MQVKKYSGELVEFDINKLIKSLSKSGASPEVVDEVIDAIQPRIYDGIHTRELYQMAFNNLKRRASSFAARYSLKRALRDLGPSGYHFEKWAARFFQHLGYETVTSQHLDGKAVSHEIDIVGSKEETLIIAECKFRNTTEAKISVTTPMYFLSRVKDLMDKPFRFFGKELKVSNGWLVTNAYLTSDAIRFSEFYGINILSWEYPEGKNIKNRVDNAGLYPLTCLTSLKKADKNVLLDAGGILVKDILDNPAIMDRLGLNEAKRRKVLEEAESLVYSMVKNS